MSLNYLHNMRIIINSYLINFLWKLGEVIMITTWYLVRWKLFLFIFMSLFLVFKEDSQKEMLGYVFLFLTNTETLGHKLCGPLYSWSHWSLEKVAEGSKWCPVFNNSPSKVYSLARVLTNRDELSQLVLKLITVFVKITP